MNVLIAPGNEDSGTRDVATFMRRVTYKKNWTHALVKRPFNMGPLMIVVDLYKTEPDADEWTSESPAVRPVMTSVVVDVISLEQAGPAYLEHCLRRTIDNAERHEMDEWLRIDGRRVREPHPELLGPCACREVKAMTGTLWTETGMHSSLRCSPATRYVSASNLQ